MIQDIAPKKYDNHYREQFPEPGDWLLIYRNGDALCRFEEEQICFPRVCEINQEEKEMTYLFPSAGNGSFF